MSDTISLNNMWRTITKFILGELGLVLGFIGTLLIAGSAAPSSHGVGAIPGRIGPFQFLVFLPDQFYIGMRLLKIGFIVQLVIDASKMWKPEWWNLTKGLK